MGSTDLLPVCVPFLATRRSPERETRGGEVARIADLLGTPLMPWQRYVVDVALEVLPDGNPAYREIILTVPRQNGKTALTLAYELHRALAWGSRQMIAFGAQDGNAARRKLLEDQVPVLMDSPFSAAISSVIQAAGREGVTFSNGSRIGVFGSSSTAGHGRTIDLAIADEAFADQDDRRDQSLKPAMVTRVDAQFLIVSTAGDDSSLWLRRKVEMGRAAVDSGSTRDVAFFEWSCDPALDPSLPSTWALAMPALGHTICEDVVAAAYATMEEAEFRRAFLNQWVGSSNSVIPQQAWVACAAPNDKLGGNVVLGVDIHPERSFASIVGADERSGVEVLAYRSGTGWVGDEVIRLAREHHAPVVLDKFTAANLIAPLERAGILVHAVSANDLASSCADFFQLVGEQSLRIIQSSLVDELDRAALLAQKRPFGDGAWAWRRASSGDISPLVAATFAVFGVRNVERPSRDFFALVD